MIGAPVSEKTGAEPDQPSPLDLRVVATFASSSTPAPTDAMADPAADGGSARRGDGRWSFPAGLGAGHREAALDLGFGLEEHAGADGRVERRQLGALGEALHEAAAAILRGDTEREPEVLAGRELHLTFTSAGSSPSFFSSAAAGAALPSSTHWPFSWLAAWFRRAVVVRGLLGRVGVGAVGRGLVRRAGLVGRRFGFGGRGRARVR